MHTPIWTSRGAMLAAWAAIFLGFCIHYAGAQWPAVLSVVLIDGAATLLWAASATCLGAAVLRWIGAMPTGSLFISTAAAMGLGLFSILCLLLGLAGQLNRGACIALMAISLIAGIAPVAWSHRTKLGRPIDLHLGARLRAPAGAWWFWFPIAPLAAISLVGATLMPGLLWKPDDPHPYDVLIYHLQVPREWFELGQIVGLPHNVYSYFPFNVEMHNLAFMHLLGGPWAGMYSAQMIGIVFIAVASIAIHAATRSVVAAAILCAVPWCVMLSNVAYVEAGLICFTSVALAWLLRTDLRRWEWIASAMLGLACGVKWTAVAFVAAPVLVALVALRVRPRAWVAVAASSLLLASPWLVRNWVWTGNPVFPVAMNVLGHGHFSDVQAERFARAHRPREDQRAFASRAAAGWRQIATHGQYGYVFWPLAIGCAVVMWRRSESRVLVFLLVAMLGVWLFATHLMGRFYTTAIPVAAMLIGLAASHRFARPVIAVVGVVLAGVAVVMLHPKMSAAASIGQQGLYGIDRRGMTEFAKSAFGEDLVRSTHPVYVIGEGKIFWMPMPMTKIRYRTVFDVKGDASTLVYEAWATISGAGTFPVFVNPDEYSRLQGTYWQIPPIPKDWAGRAPFMSVLLIEDR